MNSENISVYQAHIVIRCTEHGIHQMIISSDEPEIVESASDAVLNDLRCHGYNAHAAMHVSDRPAEDLSPRNAGYSALARFAREIRNAAHPETLN